MKETKIKKCGHIYSVFTLFTLLLLMLLFFSLEIPHAFHVIYFSNIFLCIVGMTVGIILTVLSEKVLDLFQHQFRLVFLVSLFVFLFQVVAVRQYFFSSGWDVYTVYMASLREAKGTVDDFTEKVICEYFRLYPNNLLLVYIFSRVLKLASFFKLSEVGGYFALIVLQCGISWLSGLLTYLCTLKITENNKTAMIAYVLYVLFIGISPWVSIPYSDSFGLVFPLAILFLYLYEKKKKFWERFFHWVLIGFLTYFGYRIKPQIAIATIAILIIETEKLIKSRNSRMFCTRILCFILGIGISLCCTKMMCSQLNIKPDSEKSVSMIHYVSMGLNPETMGTYSEDDVDFASSFDTLSERNAAEWKQAINRINELGVSGVLLQWLRKTLTTYSDGMFGWGQAGTFFRQFFPEPNNGLAPFLRSVYYLDGSRYKLLSNYEQCLWLGIVAFSCVPCLIKEKHYKQTVVMLSLIGLFIFESIFEAGARYLYIYLPFYVILAADGAEILLTKIKRSIFIMQK